MRVINQSKVARCLLMAGLGLAVVVVEAAAQAPEAPQPPQPQAPPPLDGPVTELEPLPSTRPGDPGPAQPDAMVPADRLPAAAGRVHVREAPPAPIAERPSGERPDPKAQWVPGHWDWDVSQHQFVWVAGSWQVPPAGMVWVAGRWLRDTDGWSFHPGSWRRRDQVADAPTRPAWRTTGPPVDHPDDTPAAAPGPDFFFIPGHHAPSGERLVWVPGVWARLQPGWDWIPARWIRRPNGWEFREGTWVRDPGAVVTTMTRPRRRFAARPGGSGRPPLIVESDGRRAGVAAADGPPPPPYPTAPGDPIAEAESSRRIAEPGTTVVTELPPVVFGPVSGMPYYVIRPPGAFPYGPNGVVVPGAVPPFVRRMLDRVLP